MQVHIVLCVENTYEGDTTIEGVFLSEERAKREVEFLNGPDRQSYRSHYYHYETRDVD